MRRKSVGEIRAEHLESQMKTYADRVEKYEYFFWVKYVGAKSEMSQIIKREKRLLVKAKKQLSKLDI